MTNKARRLLCAALAILMGFGIVGCAPVSNSIELSGGKNQPQSGENEYVPAKNLNEAYARFTAQLLQGSLSDTENTLVSPLSVILALAMTQNGANGETLEQMEAALGGLEREELNACLRDYASSLPSDENAMLHIANSLWFKDSEGAITLREEFLNSNSEYYGASIYSSPFDESTVKDINSWVKDNTDKMIDKIVSDIPPDAIMYIINALAFEAKWRSPYEKSDVSEAEFHKSDGSTQTVDFMYGKEFSYLEGCGATGFTKIYSGGRYAFAALLPTDKNQSISDFIGSIDGEELSALLLSPTIVETRTAMPKFEYDFSLSLKDTLAAMGIEKAFDADAADFTNMGESEYGNIFIGDVMHKTYIKVDEDGTKAAAVTSAMMCGSAMPNEDYKEVTLDRPFLFTIYDTETGMPLFIGTVLYIK